MLASWWQSLLDWLRRCRALRCLGRPLLRLGGTPSRNEAAVIASQGAPRPGGSYRQAADADAADADACCRRLQPGRQPLWPTLCRCSLFFQKEMELSLIGLQNAGKTSLVNVLTTGQFHEVGGLGAVGGVRALLAGRVALALPGLPPAPVRVCSQHELCIPSLPLAALRCRRRT